MTTFTLRFDEQTKSSLDKLCDSIGMNLTTFFMVYVKQSIKENRIPFSIGGDPFYSESNQRALKESIEQEKRGEVVTMTLDDLKRLVDEANTVHKPGQR